MTRKYLCWDIEICKVLPEGETDWKAHRPLGISCAATYAQGETGPRVWHPSNMEGTSPTMSREDLIYFVDYLNQLVEDGYTVLGHNSLSFDFDILAEESGLFDECKALALDHVDTMFNVHALKGFPLGLDAICRGMSLQGKSEGVNGAMAPRLWAEGRYEEVLAYVAQDTMATLDMALAVEKRHYLAWITKAGRRRVIPMANGWATVAECLTWEEPSQSWMTDPILRSDMLAWMGQ